MMRRSEPSPANRAKSAVFANAASWCGAAAALLLVLAAPPAAAAGGDPAPTAERDRPPVLESKPQSDFPSLERRFAPDAEVSRWIENTERHFALMTPATHPDQWFATALGLADALLALPRSEATLGRALEIYRAVRTALPPDTTEDTRIELAFRIAEVAEVLGAISDFDDVAPRIAAIDEYKAALALLSPTKHRGAWIEAQLTVVQLMYGVKYTDASVRARSEVIAEAAAAAIAVIDPLSGDRRWIFAHRRLSLALHGLAVDQPPEQRRDLIERAIAALDAIERVAPRATDPKEFVETAIAKAGLLLLRSEGSPAVEDMAAAEGLLREAIVAATEAGDGFQVAQARTDLARLLSRWGEQARDIDRIDAALAVLVSALAALDETADPIEWLNTLRETASIENTGAAIAKDLHRYDRAITLFRRVLERFPGEGDPTDFREAARKSALASTSENFARALYGRVPITFDRALAAEAIAQYEAAATAFDAVADAEKADLARLYGASVTIMLAEKTADRDRLAAATEMLSRLADRWSQDDAPYDFAAHRHATAEALDLWAELDGDLSRNAEALAAIEAALAAYRAAKADDDVVADAEADRARILARTQR